MQRIRLINAFNSLLMLPLDKMFSTTAELDLITGVVLRGLSLVLEDKNLKPIKESIMEILCHLSANYCKDGFGIMKFNISFDW
jgi:hypothetical protein